MNFLGIGGSFGGKEEENRDSLALWSRVEEHNCPMDDLIPFQFGNTVALPTDRPLSANPCNPRMHNLPHRR